MARALVAAKARASGRILQHLLATCLLYHAVATASPLRQRTWGTSGRLGLVMGASRSPSARKGSTAPRLSKKSKLPYPFQEFPDPHPMVGHTPTTLPQMLSRL